MDATFPLVRLADVAAVVGAEVRGDPQTFVRDAAYDSRTVPPGSVFFCIPGATADGHDFASAAVASGAVALVVEHPVDIGVPQIGVPQIVVPSVRRAIGPMSAVIFGDPGAGMTLVGITGTNGKTTTSYLLESILSAAGRMPGVVGTTGVRIDGNPGPLARTTPEAPDLQRLLARMRVAGVRAVALEVSSHALAQHRVDGVVMDVALFTNLSQDHLDFHGSMQDYFGAKALLFAPSHARHGVVNADDVWGRRLLEEPSIPTTTFALDAQADLRARDIEVREDGVGFAVDGLEVRSALRGRFNIENCLGALAVSRVLGIPGDDAVSAIASVPLVPGRMEPVEAGQGYAVVVDYAHTPDSILNVLRGARALAAGRVIVVFGCGGDRDRAKRPIMGRVAAEESDLAIVTSDNPRSEDPAAIIDQVVAGMAAGASYLVEPDRRSAIALGIAEARDGDVVVIAGKGHETYQEVGVDVLAFDDRVAAREAIAARSGAC
ncbi:MAG: UDP-N-acetylmuramoyl-L-alanyl-D-glutamate--2,6-diaminopimelate ligase [Actinomycetota bacterium]